MRRVAHGEANRRQFIRTMLGLGLSGPLIAEMLSAQTSAMAQGTRVAQPTFTPTKRGGGGKLRLLWWQAPTILNAHLATRVKDREASRVVCEPSIGVNPDGDFIPILAEEVPTFENGGRSRDGTWTMWRLKQGVVWHDDKPFTADDVIFTWEYAADPATAAVTSGGYEDILGIDKLNDHTIKVVFKEPTPLWGLPGLILPKHRFAEYTGQNARDAPYNLTPVGTGPYKIVDFDTFSHFYADMQMYQICPTIRPQRWMRQFVSWEIAQKVNNWPGLNKVRWSNAEYDRLWKEATAELDPVKAAALIIRMNDLVIEDVVVIPVVLRHGVAAVSHTLRGLELGPWDLQLWNLAYWYRET